MQYYHRKDIETQSGHTIAQWNFTPGLEMNLGSNDSNSSTVVTVVALIMAQNRIRAQFKIFCRNYGPIAKTVTARAIIKAPTVLVYYNHHLSIFCFKSIGSTNI